MNCEIKDILDKDFRYRNKLFIRGFLITNNFSHDMNEFPFYGNWNSLRVGDYYILTHKDLKCHSYQTAYGTTLFLIGHCLNPYDGLFCEQEILQKISKIGEGKIFNARKYIDTLTGSFFLAEIDGEKLSFMSDAAGMLFSCYGVKEERLIITSHPKLADDLYGLSKSSYICELEKYKYFYKYGLFFPGDLTQYCELKRTLQNHVITYEGNEFNCERFYPYEELNEVQTKEEYDSLVETVVDVLKKTIDLACLKWPDIALSMTGGMDSKTALACSTENQSKLKFYSYISMDGDKPDALAAKKIAEHLGIDHKIYEISENDGDFADIELIRAIMHHNNGGYVVNKNDVRKRAYFSEKEEFDVEIKSWISEIARANYYKKFGLSKMPEKLTPRQMTSMYKIFITQRALAKKTDKVFQEFIDKTKFHELPSGYDQSDMYLWEFRYSAWGGMVITMEHSFSNEIFIPFNNRELLDLMLKAPLKKRITDKFHEDLIACANKKVDEPGITITNWNETRKRMYIEKAYFKIHSFFSKF